MILGGGESGIGAVLLAKALGMEVFLSDGGIIPAQNKKLLIDLAIDFEEGSHEKAMDFEASFVVKSPGIPDKASIVKHLKKKKLEIISEIEFGFRYSNAKIIAITGTNGKTTTTLLTFHILKSAGFNVVMAGNVGVSYAKEVAEELKKSTSEKKDLIYVLEVSSFQLDGIKKFKPNVAVITNITPDHLDRYDYKIEKYVDSKFKIAQNLDEDDFFIYGIDSELIENRLIDFDTDATELPFSVFPDEFDGACGDEDGITIQMNNAESFISTQESVLKGEHNLYNTMAASLACIAVGVQANDIEKALKTFVNAPHRMQKIAEIKGVSYVNDSKATNIDAAYYALDAYNQSLIWIAGGVDKGNDYKTLIPVVKGKVKALICLTNDDEKLKQTFKGIIPEIVSTTDVNEAVKMAYDLAVEGDLVLLSPCCASFDLFKNYEDRGQKFESAVINLKNQMIKG